jgi:hypothetical protein
LEDSGFVEEMLRRGVDLKEKKTTLIGENGGLDPSYF